MRYSVTPEAAWKHLHRHTLRHSNTGTGSHTHACTHTDSPTCAINLKGTAKVRAAGPRTLTLLFWFLFRASLHPLILPSLHNLTLSSAFTQCTNTHTHTWTYNLSAKSLGCHYGIIYSKGSLEGRAEALEDLQMAAVCPSYVTSHS